MKNMAPELVGCELSRFYKSSNSDHSLIRNAIYSLLAQQKDDPITVNWVEDNELNEKVNEIGKKRGGSCCFSL